MLGICFMNSIEQLVQLLKIIVILVSTLTFLVVFLLLFTRRRGLSNKSRDYFNLVKYECNPIISPTPYNPHEDMATFNPTVILGSDNNFHMIYRAVGSDGVSRLGYAFSRDGYNFEYKTPYPIFFLDETAFDKNLIKKYDFSINPSGGSSFGTEDPRLTKIGNEVFLLAGVFAGWDFMKIGLSWIKEDDLINGRFDWSHTRIISPEGERHKNWVIFPEKINGKYAILHGISPKIMIDYVDDLKSNFIIKSQRGEGTQPGREESWDSRLRGAGPSPIKTDAGWLLLYHANDNREPYKYKLGAMLLDIDDPTRILYRSNQPILVPESYYENDEKPGIVFSCGAVVKDGSLFVYYGGGDKYCCVAETKLDELVNWLKS